MLSDRFRAAAEQGTLSRAVPGLFAEDAVFRSGEGAIVELTVMIRPASALQTVGARMAAEFARLGLGAPG